MLVNGWWQMHILKEQHNWCSLRNCKDAIEGAKRSTSHAERGACKSGRLNSKRGPELCWVSQVHPTCELQILPDEGHLEKCQLYEQRGTILQRAAGPSFCWAGFSLGMGVVSLHFSCRGKALVPEFCSLQVLLVPFQALLSAFALSVQALPPPAESCYCQTLGVEEQEGMPSALVKHLQMHGTFIFFNYRMLFFFFSPCWHWHRKATGRWCKSEKVSLQAMLVCLKLLTWHV